MRTASTNALRATVFILVALILLTPHGRNSALAAPPDNACLVCAIDKQPGTETEAPNGSLSAFVAQPNTSTDDGPDTSDETIQGVTTPRIQDEANPNGVRNNIFTGEPAEGEFSSSEWKLFYIDNPDKYPFLPGEVPTAEDVWGKISDFYFESYKTTLDVVFDALTWLVFGLIIIQALMVPALELAEALNTTMVGPFDLTALVLSALVVYITYQTLRARYGQAINQTAVTIVILATLTLVTAAETLNWILSLTNNSTAAVMMVGTGQDPANIPGPSTGPVDVTISMAAADTLTGDLKTTMVANTAELLTFGSYLPDECKEAYAAGRALNLPAGDGRNLEALSNIEACVPYVEIAMAATPSRVIGAMFLSGYAVILAIALTLIALFPIVGQVKLMAATAAHPLLFLGLALPGSWGATALRWILSAILGLAHLLVFALALIFMLVGMNAIFAASGDWIIFWRLTAALMVPLGVVVMYVSWAIRKKKQVTQAAARRGWKPRERSGAETLIRKTTGLAAKAGIYSAAHGATAGVSTGIKAGAGATKKATQNTQRVVKKTLVGTDTKRGLLYGPAPRLDPEREKRHTNDLPDTNPEHGPSTAPQEALRRQRAARMDTGDAAGTRLRRHHFASDREYEAAVRDAGGHDTEERETPRRTAPGRSARDIATDREYEAAVHAAGEREMRRTTGHGPRSGSATRPRPSVNKQERQDKNSSSNTNRRAKNPKTANNKRKTDESQGATRTSEEEATAKTRTFVRRVRAGIIPGAVVTGTGAASHVVGNAAGRVATNVRSTWTPPEAKKPANVRAVDEV